MGCSIRAVSKKKEKKKNKIKTTWAMCPAELLFILGFSVCIESSNGSSLVQSLSLETLPLVLSLVAGAGTVVQLRPPPSQRGKGKHGRPSPSHALPEQTQVSTDREHQPGQEWGLRTTKRRGTKLSQDGRPLLNESKGSVEHTRSCQATCLSRKAPINMTKP